MSQLTQHQLLEMAKEVAENQGFSASFRHGQLTGYRQVASVTFGYSSDAYSDISNMIDAVCEGEML